MADVGNESVQPAKRMRLRYAGSCEICKAKLPSGTEAWYEPERKKVRCLSCPEQIIAAGTGTSATAGVTPAGKIERGQAGASAQREAERRSTRRVARVEAEIAVDAAWRRKVKEDHAVIGRLAAGLTPKPSLGKEPQHIRAWSTGADGERKVGRRLDEWASSGIGRIALHDRRIRGGRSNIDHLAITPAGVWVIDAKEYHGKVEHVNVGGMFRPDVRLKVGGRDRSKLAEGVRWQMENVAAALDQSALQGCRPAVFGMLCFVGAEWGVFSKPFTFAGVQVAWPLAAIQIITAPGHASHDEVVSAAEVLAGAFPTA